MFKQFLSKTKMIFGIQIYFKIFEMKIIMNFFTKIKNVGQNLKNKVSTQVSSLKHNAQESMDVLKSVVSEIKNEIKPQQKSNIR